MSISFPFRCQYPIKKNRNEKEKKAVDLWSMSTLTLETNNAYLVMYLLRLNFNECVTSDIRYQWLWTLIINLFCYCAREVFLLA